MLEHFQETPTHPYLKPRLRRTAPEFSENALSSIKIIWIFFIIEFFATTSMLEEAQAFSRVLRRTEITMDEIQFTAPHAPVSRIAEPRCPTGQRRMSVDGVDASGHFTDGFSVCEPVYAEPPEPKKPDTPAELFAYFPEVLIGTVTRIETSENRRFPEPGFKTFNVNITFRVGAVEKGSGRPGQLVTVVGWRVESSDPATRQLAAGVIPATVKAGDRVQTYLYSIKPDPLPFIAFPKAFEIIDLVEKTSSQTD